MKNIEQITTEIEAMGREIWSREQEPQEVTALKKNCFVPSGTVPSVLYACFDVANGSSYLVIVRDMLKDPQNRLRECTVLLKKMLLAMACRYATWGLQDIADRLQAACDCLSGAADRDALLRMVEKLLVYNNKLWNWLDMTIPWFELDQKIKLR